MIITIFVHFLIILLICFDRISAQSNYVSTVAGSGSFTYAEGTGVGASFFYPFGLCIDSTGNNLFVADTWNHRIRKIVISSGVVTTVAGSGSAAFSDGTGVAASFTYPFGISIDSSGNNLYVSDTFNNRIRKIVISSGVVTTIAGSGVAAYADGTGVEASFYNPKGLAIDSSGDNFYVVDDNCLIRKIVLSTRAVTTLAGSRSAAYADGVGVAASFNGPSGICIDSSGVILYLTDQYNHRIRQIVISTRMVTTVAGSGSATYADGVGIAASFNYPSGISIDPTGNYLFVVERGSNRVRQIVISTRVVTTLAGSGSAAYADGIGIAASLNSPSGICIDSAGASLYVADTNNNRIRMISSCPTVSPTLVPTLSPTTLSPTIIPSVDPSTIPTFSPTIIPTVMPTSSPSNCPSSVPTLTPSFFSSNQCSAGTYAVDYACIKCSPGYYSSSVGSVNCIPCSGGTFASSPGSTNCLVCPTGQTSLPGASVCSSCPAGSYTSMFDTRCAFCAPGFYSESAGSTSCGGCPAGKWSSAGSSSCNPCLAGSYSLNSQYTCSFCPAGLFSSPGSSTCSTCPLGTYSSPGAAVCISCPAGTYSFQCIGTCAYCPSGLYAGSGASICSPCPHGTTSIGGSSSCVKISGNTSSCFG